MIRTLLGVAVESEDLRKYIAAAVAAFLLAVVLTPVMRWYAHRREIVDTPGGHKSHQQATPYLGGVAMLLAFAISVAVGAVLSEPDGTRGELFLILGIASFLAGIGLLDDLKDLGPIIRLACEVGAGIVLWMNDVRVEAFGAQWMNAAVTIIWVVGIINALNLLDNMDGLSSGVTSIAAAWITFIAAANGQYLVAVLAAAVLGCASGFLWHNFHPATIYMGDAGALFLGFLLAYLGLKLRFGGPTSTTVLVPIAVLAVPIFDTALVTVSRLRHGKSPFLGGKDHVSHRLVLLGLPVRVAVILIYLVALAAGACGYAISRLEQNPSYVLFGTGILIACVTAYLLSQVEVYGEDDARRRADRSNGSIAAKD